MYIQNKLQEMLHRFVEENTLKVVVGVPIILLIFFLSFGQLSLKIEDLSITENSPDKIANINFKTLTDKFINALDSTEQNDSTFFCSTFEAFSRKELVIFKTFPSEIDKKLDFLVELYPTNKSLLKKGQAFLQFNITNEATIYRHNQKVYGVYTKALPLINVEKLVVRQKSIEKKIISPFNTINKEFNITQTKFNGQKKIPDTYLKIFQKTLKENNISFLPYAYNLKKDSLVQIKQSLDQYISKNNQTIGVINKSNQFWSLIDKKNNALLKDISFFGTKGEEAIKLLRKYINGNLQLDSVINLEMLASYYALKNVFTNGCNEKMYLLYNSETKLLEPFFSQSNCLGLNPKNIKPHSIKNLTFINLYIQALNSVSQISLYEDFIEEDDSFEQEIGIINSHYPNLIFDIDVLYLNQRIIKKSLDATTEIIAELVSSEKNKIIVKISNNSIFPVDILGLNFKTNKKIVRFNTAFQILSRQKDTIEINLPRSFENLFVNKKKKQTGFMPYKDTYNLNIAYSLSNLNTSYLAPISPYQQTVIKSNDDLFRVKNNVTTQDGLIILEEQKIITFNKETIVIKSPLIIPKGYQFRIKQGTTINILNGGKIISYSPLIFTGSKKRPIKIYSSDQKGQGILVLSNGKQSKLNHVIFDQLSNPTQLNWNITGAVTFYESPVELKHVEISNNHCEDALNIVRTTFIIDSCTINNTQSDAFDGDFVEGIIKNSKFINLGNDAIDVSGSDLKISRVVISNANDKGLSAGEDSRMFVDNVTIKNSEIAIAGKDLSIIHGKNLKIINTKLAFTAFQKKSEYGPSTIFVESVDFKTVETRYLIESTSSMKVDGKVVETSENVKGRMYGVEFGISSDKTRNRQL